MRFKDGGEAAGAVQLACLLQQRGRRWRNEDQEGRRRPRSASKLCSRRCGQPGARPSSWCCRSAQGGSWGGGTRSGPLNPRRTGHLRRWKGGVVAGAVWSQVGLDMGVVLQLQADAAVTFTLHPHQACGAALR